MIVQIIDFCDLNDQEKREDFWIDKLQTIYPEALNMKKLINKKCFNWVIEYTFCCILIISKELINIMTSENTCYILTCHVKLKFATF